MSRNKTLFEEDISTYFIGVDDYTIYNYILGAFSINNIKLVNSLYEKYK